MTQILTCLKDKQVTPLYEEFKNNKFKHKYQCKNGHIFYSSWTNLKQSKGSSCAVCAGQVINLELLHIKAKSRNGSLLTKAEDYKNNKQKLLWKCSENHEFLANWANIQNNKWCPICAGNTPRDIKDLQNHAENKNGNLISTQYEKAKTKYEWKCEHGHVFKANWNNVKSNKWCPKCTNQVSNEEKEVQEFLKSCSTDVIQSYKVPKSRKEFDILVNHRLAVEYHGLYWHSEAVSTTSKLLPKTKLELAEKCGFELIQLFSDEWLCKGSIVKSLLKSKLGIYETKIKANKCQIKNTTNLVSFFEANHLAGNVRAIKVFYLEYQGQIVSALSLRKPFTKAHKGSIEIARFANKLNYKVDFAFSKLLKHAEAWAKEQGFTSILSYADCRISSGKVYKVTGFKHLGRTSPNYFYTNGKIREGRFKRRKRADLAGSSEREQNNLQGWFAIYDAGSEIFKKEIK